MPANQGGPAARPRAPTGPDSIELIARDAASYAEGAGEPEFSQFLQIEARLLALIRMKAGLADALYGLFYDDGACDLGCEKNCAHEKAYAALRAVGRLP